MSRVAEQPTRYSAVAQYLHWAIALLIVLNLTVGSFMESLPNPIRGRFVLTHASVGFTVFWLSMVRIAWRLTHRPPPFSPLLKAWERTLAHFAHAFLYLLMIVMPVLGWMIVSSSNVNRPIMMYGVLHLPAFAPLARIPLGPDRVGAHHDFVTAHAIGAWILVALLALHVAGAVKHQLAGHPQLQRIWPRRGS